MRTYSLLQLFAAIACPGDFYYSLGDVNSHLVFQRQEHLSIHEEAYQQFLGAVQTDPNVVNCIEIDESVLASSFDPRMVQCPYLDLVPLLLKKGAKISEPDQTLNNTLLYQAVSAYGYIWGTPILPDLKRTDCQTQNTEAEFRAIIKTILDQSVRIDGKLKYEWEIKSIAKENHVEFLL